MRRARLTLIFITVLFLAPVVVAVLMNSGWWQYRPTGLTNRGQLVTPPLALDTTSWQPPLTRQPRGGPWTVLYPVSLPCAAACMEDIRGLRQVWRAAGRNQQHIDLVLLVSGPEQPGAERQLRDAYPEFLLARDTEGVSWRMLAVLGARGRNDGPEPGQAFLVDPAGNIMMRYAPGFDPNHVKSDLKRLLKWSGQGR